MKLPALPGRHRRLARMAGMAAWAALLLATSACTTLPSAPLWAEATACRAWTAGLDEAVTAARVGDAEAERIAGVAGLRVDRTGSALRAEARRSDAAFAAWVRRAAALDEAARKAEIANLPDAAFPIDGTPRAGASDRTDDCRRRAVQQVLAPASAALRESLLDRAQVPARYSTARRAFGLYPLLRWPFFAGVLGWQDGQTADMARWTARPPPLQRFSPLAAASPSAVAEGLPPWPPASDDLGLPQPTPAASARLLAWHAPVFEIEVRGDFDRFGALSWPGEGPPQVETAKPVVYQRVSHMRWQGRWLLQLSYTLWFPERPPRSAVDLLAGALDGVVVRLTLDEQGRPMLMDTMHSCGCYHLFFPSSALRPRGDAPRHEEWLFAPAPLPVLPPTHRLVVRLASATHYVMGLGTRARGEADEAAYTLRAEEALRSLPAPQGRRSLFGPDGLVAGTERAERFLFWPMGITSAGAMRQWGHHATAFVGRRHFDDADLIERRFEAAR